MIALKVVFSIDATGSAKDITEKIFIPSNIWLYSFHDKDNYRLYDEVKRALEYKGYDFKPYYFFQLMTISTL
jgi:hypothetical protein